MKNLVIVRGAGDIASGIIYKLYKSGFKIICLEIEQPTAIRRTVSFSEAIYSGKMVIEDVEAIRCDTVLEALKVSESKVAVLVDEKLEILQKIKPTVLVDAILAKKNLGTKINMANIVIGVGPGFTPKEDVDICIETARGHNLGKVLTAKKAKINTGIPGKISNYGVERVFHSPLSGNLVSGKKIGEIVKKGEVLFTVDNLETTALFEGLIRGMIRDGFVKKGLKVADVDPRVDEIDNCYKISDKARNIAGGVLEGILNLGGFINE